MILQIYQICKVRSDRSYDGRKNKAISVKNYFKILKIFAIFWKFDFLKQV